MTENPEWGLADKIASASGPELRELAKNLSDAPYSIEGGPDHSVRRVLAEARAEERQEARQEAGQEGEVAEPPEPGPGDGGTSTAPPATISLEHETDPVLVRKAAASLRRG